MALDIVLAWCDSVAPLLFRRRFPFGAPVAVGAAVVDCDVCRRPARAVPTS